MQKLQKFIDTAALAVQPIEEDPVKKKKLAKQCDCDPDLFKLLTCMPHLKVCSTGMQKECAMHVLFDKSGTDVMWTSSVQSWRVQEEEGQREPAAR